MPFGPGFKEANSVPGPWGVYMMMQGETVPRRENHVRLSPDRKDAWGIPQLVTSIGYDDNDEKLLRDFLARGQEMLEAVGHEYLAQYAEVCHRVLKPDGLIALHVLRSPTPAGADPVRWRAPARRRRRPPRHGPRRS